MKANDMNGNMDFPRSIVDAIDALGDKHRRQILIYLKEKGALAYSELQSITSLEKGTLNHHLERMMTGAVIRNFRGEFPTSQYNSYYELSGIGRRLVESIFAAFTPPVQSTVTISSASTIAAYTVPTANGVGTAAIAPTPEVYAGSSHERY
jgi:DNA-binding HxlR family transcriptional regulator